MTREPEEVAAELERLRKLEQSLRAERERIRALAADEVAQLQKALRESAARAAQREREVQALRAQLQRGSGGLQLRRRRLRSNPETTGAVQRVLVTFERERQQLEERARAVAQTELRQRKTQTELDAERGRLAKAGEGVGGQQQLLSELRAAEIRIGELEAQLRDHDETQAALDAARGELAALARVEQPALGEEILVAKEELARREAELSQREIELSLLRRRIGDEERSLQERAWRTGAPRRRDLAPITPRSTGDLSFSEGWRLLSRGRDVEPPAEPAEWGGGNW